MNIINYICKNNIHLFCLEIHVMPYENKSIIEIIPSNINFFSTRTIQINKIYFRLNGPQNTFGLKKLQTQLTTNENPKNIFLHCKNTTLKLSKINNFNGIIDINNILDFDLMAKVEEL